MCDRCAGTLFREGETGQLFLENYRSAFGFGSLKLIMTIDAIENQATNGHISFGKWVGGIDDEWIKQYIHDTTPYRCASGEQSAGIRFLPNYALKEGPWIVHRFVEGALTGSFNTGHQTVGECPYYAAPAAAAAPAPAGAGGGH